MFAPKLKSLLLHKIYVATLKNYLSVSTVQCEQVCVLEGILLILCDVTVKRMVPIEGTNWAVSDLELFQIPIIS